MSAGRTGRLLLAAACVAALARPARAQDFVPIDAAGPAQTAAAFLDTGRPPRDAGVAVEALGIARYALPEVSTRAVALGAGWRTLRGAAGFSQTGDPGIGWGAGGAAFGVASPGWGAGLRAVARRDLTPSWPAPAWGFEGGMGMWVRPGRTVIAWASAPQLWTDGAAVPLARGLALGVMAEGRDARAWFEHEARPDAPGAGVTHRAGLALATGSADVWVEGLDAPLRAALGVRVRATLVTASARVESHPLLGETVSVSLGVGARPRAQAAP